MTELDFVDAKGAQFKSMSGFFKYIDAESDLQSEGGNTNFVASVNNYQSRSGFFDSLESQFEILWAQGDLCLLAANAAGKTVPYYAYYDDHFPVFVTTANITEEMPPTIEKYLQSDSQLGRFWMSMEQMDKLRRHISHKYPELVIPFYTAKYYKHSGKSPRRRPDVDRTISYWGEDGKESYKEMRSKYGVAPTNIRFSRPGDFKFGVKSEGVFTHMNGSVEEIWDLLESEKKRKLSVKNAINSGGRRETTSRIFGEIKVSGSDPWAVALSEKTIEDQDLTEFQKRVEDDKWDFNISERSMGSNSFEMEIVDTVSYGRTELIGSNDQIRIYPIDGNDIDPQLRAFNLVQDHFDSACYAKEVV
jgi:hypothetical protein